MSSYSLTLFLLRTEGERATHTRLAQVWLIPEKGSVAEIPRGCVALLLSHDWERPNFSLEWTLRTRSRCSLSPSRRTAKNPSRENAGYITPSPSPLWAGSFSVSTVGRSVGRWRKLNLGPSSLSSRSLFLSLSGASSKIAQGRHDCSGWDGGIGEWHGHRTPAEMKLGQKRDILMQRGNIFG